MPRPRNRSTNSTPKPLPDRFCSACRKYLQGEALARHTKYANVWLHPTCLTLDNVKQYANGHVDKSRLVTRPQPSQGLPISRTRRLT